MPQATLPISPALRAAAVSASALSTRSAPLPGQAGQDRSNWPSSSTFDAPGLGTIEQGKRLSGSNHRKRRSDAGDVRISLQIAAAERLRATISIYRLRKT